MGREVDVQSVVKKLTSKRQHCTEEIKSLFDCMTVSLLHGHGELRDALSHWQ